MNDTWSLPLALVAFVLGAAATALGGVRLSGIGDHLADRTGWGEAVFGAVFFGAVISLSGIVMTATAAASGLPRMAYSNAVGGVAAQTVALTVADAAYRHANLEHAAASLPNIFFGTLLMALLALALATSFAPPVAVLGIHPGSVLLLVAYAFGVVFSRQVRRDPMWRPTDTALTVEDEPREPEPDVSSLALWTRFAAMGLLVTAGGWAVARGAEGLLAHTGLDESFIGAFFMGVTNAIPETVTAVAAVRAGALTLAVGGVLGGNTFDVLNLAVGDVAYRGGSLYHAAGREDLLLTTTTLLITAILVGGLVRRQRVGPGRVGLESVLVPLLWVGTIVVLGV